MKELRDAVYRYLFQFLIGRLKTGDNGNKNILRRRVSIPYR